MIHNKPHKTPPEERVPLKNKLGFGSGAVAECIMGNSIGQMANYVLNIGLGVRPELVGWLLSIPRIWDAFTDPVVGSWSDNFRSRFGRRRPFIFAGALLSSMEQLNLAHKILTVHRGKGRKDRTVPLPECMIPMLEEHLTAVRKQFDEDVASGFAGAFMPEGSPEKWKYRALHWPWQFLFPAKTLTLVPVSGERRRYHIHDSQFSAALRDAVRKAGISKRVGMSLPTTLLKVPPASLTMPPPRRAGWWAFLFPVTN